MKKFYLLIPVMFVMYSCSTIGGPDGYFPTKKYDFIEEEIEQDISIPDELSNPNKENHYPVNNIFNIV